MIPRDLQYGRPEAAYLVLITFVLFVFFWNLYQFRKKALEGALRGNRAHGLIQLRSRFYYWIKSALIGLAWVFAVVALMDPKGNARYSGVPQAELNEELKLPRKAHDLIFLLDASASMSSTDTRTGRTRLEYAKEIIDEIVNLLNGETVALDAFTSQVTPVVPLTMDYLFLRLMLQAVALNEGDVAGTDLLQALAVLHKENFSVEDAKRKTLVLLSDGGDTYLEAAQGEVREAQVQTILKIIGNAEVENLRVFCIGMGSREGAAVPKVEFEGRPVHSSLDEDLLQRLSERGRGRYYFANDFSASSIASDLVHLMNQDEVLLEDVKDQSNQKRSSALAENPSGRSDLIYDLFFQYPLSLALACLILAWLWPDVRKRVNAKC